MGRLYRPPTDRIRDLGQPHDRASRGRECDLAGLLASDRCLLEAREDDRTELKEAVPSENSATEAEVRPILSVLSQLTPERILRWAISGRLVRPCTALYRPPRMFPWLVQSVNIIIRRNPPIYTLIHSSKIPVHLPLRGPHAALRTCPAASRRVPHRPLRAMDQPTRPSHALPACPQAAGRAQTTQQLAKCSEGVNMRFWTALIHHWIAHAEI